MWKSCGLTFLDPWKYRYIYPSQSRFSVKFNMAFTLTKVYIGKIQTLYVMKIQNTKYKVISCGRSSVICMHIFSLNNLKNYYWSSPQLSLCHCIMLRLYIQLTNACILCIWPEDGALLPQRVSSIQTWYWNHYKATLTHLLWLYYEINVINNVTHPLL